MKIQLHYISFICLPNGSIHRFFYALMPHNMKECFLIMNAFITFTKTYNLDAVGTAILKMNKLCSILTISIKPGPGLAGLTRLSFALFSFLFQFLLYLVDLLGKQMVIFRP